MFRALGHLRIEGLWALRSVLLLVVVGNGEILAVLNSTGDHHI